MADNHRLGAYGERLALNFFRRRGYHILEENYRFDRCEIDLICLDPARPPHGEVVFVEVKTRRSAEYGTPEHSITGKKQEHLARVARGYLLDNKLADHPCRFDVVSIIIGRGKQPFVRHIPNAFFAP